MFLVHIYVCVDIYVFTHIYLHTHTHEIAGLDFSKLLQPVIQADRTFRKYDMKILNMNALYKRKIQCIKNSTFHCGHFLRRLALHIHLSALFSHYWRGQISCY